MQPPIDAWALVAGSAARRGRFFLPPGAIQLVDGNSWLNFACSICGIDADQLPAESRQIEHDRAVGALAGKAGAAAARKQRDAMIVAILEKTLHLLGAGGQDHSERLDFVERCIGGVEPAVVPIEADLADGKCQKFRGNALEIGSRLLDDRQWSHEGKL